MQFTEKKDRNNHYKNWRFVGECKDKKTRKIYIFSTNSIYEFSRFKDNGEWLGMEFVKGKFNEDYSVVRKLIPKPKDKDVFHKWLDYEGVE